MSSDWMVVQDLAAAIEIPQDGILTRTLHEDEAMKVVIFGFSAGQELSEHTASKPATLYFTRGEAKVQLGGEEHMARPGTWLRMAPQVAHSIMAETPVVMLLMIIKSAPSLGR